MKNVLRTGVLALALAGAPLTAAADPLSYDQLKTLVTNMGYTPKEVGVSTPKMEILVVTPSFNVPIGLEVTASQRYVWLTANLGPSKLTPDQALALLKRSSEWQPTQFWVTSSNNLTIGLAINNTDVKPDVMKFQLEKLAGDVGKSSDIWQGTAAAPASGQ